MPVIESTAPTWRALLPFCFVIRRANRWVGVCCFGADEHHTPTRLGTRAAALADAKRIAASLVHNKALDCPQDAVAQLENNYDGFVESLTATRRDGAL
jgi:hypothetical protein